MNWTVDIPHATNNPQSYHPTEQHAQHLAQWIADASQRTIYVTNQDTGERFDVEPLTLTIEDMHEEYRT